MLSLLVSKTGLLINLSQFSRNSFDLLMKHFLKGHTCARTKTSTSHFANSKKKIKLVFIGVGRQTNLRASSIDSGNLLPNVSGKRTARAPATVATRPIIKTGAGNQ